MLNFSFLVFFSCQRNDLASLVTASVTPQSVVALEDCLDFKIVISLEHGIVLQKMIFFFLLNSGVIQAAPKAHTHHIILHHLFMSSSKKEKSHTAHFIIQLYVSLFYLFVWLALEQHFPYLHVVKISSFKHKTPQKSYQVALAQKSESILDYCPMSDLIKIKVNIVEYFMEFRFLPLPTQNLQTPVIYSLACK